VRREQRRRRRLAAVPFRQSAVGVDELEDALDSDHRRFQRGSKTRHDVLLFIRRPRFLPDYLRTRFASFRHPVLGRHLGKSFKVPVGGQQFDLIANGEARQDHVRHG
jgi:hypothetical protein